MLCPPTNTHSSRLYRYASCWRPVSLPLSPLSRSLCPAQFFDDQLLAFCVLAVAWLCEVTVAVSNRHWVSRHYLPRLLFTYFLAFHMYFFSYPLGYAWLSLGTCVAFMAHAVIALWNRWELPLLVTRQWQQHLRAQRQ